MMNHSLSALRKYKTILIFLSIIIITLPAFRVLFESPYFSMHDDQHIARLYVLDQAIHQGDLYPRWVEMLGFGYGYPLYNFYPPLIYYVAEIFVLLGFSYIASIKAMIICGFLVGAGGMYMYARKFVGALFGLAVSTLFTYFGYKAVTVFVRGAFAEFFGISLFPFVLVALHNAYKEASIKNGLIFGLMYGLVILAHPFIALPGSLFLLLMVLVYVFLSYHNKVHSKKHFLVTCLTGVIFALGLTSFFWLPSLVERSSTLTNDILLTELADYTIHFVYPSQFWYSPWGYGGSVNGLGDGMSFQINKLYTGLAFISLLLYLILNTYKKKDFLVNIRIQFYCLFLFLTVFSIFMTTSLSSPIWMLLPYLHYLQFPWRFLSFTNIFISFVGGYALFFTMRLTSNTSSSQRDFFKKLLLSFFVILIVVITQYDKFTPQKKIFSGDSTYISYNDIAWRISRSSFEFIPKGVVTQKSSLGTTIPAITENDIKKTDYIINEKNAHVSVDFFNNTYRKKQGWIESDRPTNFTLQTFNFPGWTAYIDGRETPINDNNDFKLITISVPAGRHAIEFFFEDTPVRIIGNSISLITLLVATLYTVASFIRSKRRNKSRLSRLFSQIFQ